MKITSERFGMLYHVESKGNGLTAERPPVEDVVAQLQDLQRWHQEPLLITNQTRSQAYLKAGILPKDLLVLHDELCGAERVVTNPDRKPIQDAYELTRLTDQDLAEEQLHDALAAIRPKSINLFG